MEHGQQDVQLAILPSHTCPGSLAPASDSSCVKAPAQSSVGTPADVILSWGQVAGHRTSCPTQTPHSTQHQALQHRGRPSWPALFMNAQDTSLGPLAELSLCSHLLQGQEASTTSASSTHTALWPSHTLLPAHPRHPAAAQ